MWRCQAYLNRDFRNEGEEISLSIVVRTIHHFEDTERNKNRPKLGRTKTETTEERQFELIQFIRKAP